MLSWTQAILISKRMKQVFKNRSILPILVWFTLTGFSQTTTSFPDQFHELTMYIMPEVRQIHWDNPSKLMSSAILCNIKASLQKEAYRIGHITVKINSPIFDSALYFSMASILHSEKKEQIFRKKIGLGVLGTNFAGSLEPSHIAKQNLTHYMQRNEVVYIKFRMNDESFQKILEFIAYFQSIDKAGFSPCHIYNGALYPLYAYEGAGCTAFGIALLEIAHLLPEEALSEWTVDVNIPMELIGGEMNNNKKVKLTKIYKTRKWHTGIGIEGIDYAHLLMFSPWKIAEWIQHTYITDDPVYQKDKEGKLIGLFVDRTKAQFIPDDQLLHTRQDTNFFVRYYLQTIDSQPPEF